jgi:Gp49-like protein DUF891
LPSREKNGDCPACEFFDGLSLLDKAKLMALFQIAGDHGKFHVPNPHAVYVCQNERGLILITHGFIKKKDKTPKEEITRAWRIYHEDQTQTKLAVVQKAKR